MIHTFTARIAEAKARLAAATAEVADLRTRLADELAAARAALALTCNPTDSPETPS